jgi:two-component system, OmpR family, response regulator
VARVLIVDDTEIVRRALEVAIRRMGHLAVSTSDGARALDLARAEPPDLALLDFQMPGMDGASLYQALRAALGDRCPRVLFITASPPELVAPRVEQIGPTAGYVRKPFHLEELERVVEAALR